jgi:uridine kinase
MFILGIAGGSGSGKTYLAKAIRDALPSGSADVIAVDSYYRAQHHLTLEDRAKQNYDHPDSLELNLLVEHLKCLRQGQGVAVPCYDYALHTRSSEVIHLVPKDFIIVEGILTYHLPEVRDLLDLKVFVDTPPQLCLERRLARDTVERGRTKESVLKQWEETVFPMFNKFCSPGRAHADLVWQEEGENAARIQALCSSLKTKLESLNH